MGFFLLYFRPNPLYLLMHFSDVFVQLLDRYRIEVTLWFRHVLRQIVVFLHLEFSFEFSSHWACQCAAEQIDLQHRFHPY